MSKLCIAAASVALAGSVSAASPAHAAKYEVVYNFQGGTSDGSNVPAGLLKVGGLLYGMNYGGGANGQGTVFSMTPEGVEKVVYSFQGGSDGANPWADLIDVDGTLYGTTNGGGAGSAGTIFKVTTAGVETVLYAFTGNEVNLDGIGPMAGLVKVGPMLYGTTAGGDPVNAGTVFKITPAGAYTQLYHFLGGVEPSGPTASLIPLNNRLYGTTFEGGFSHLGAAFVITKGGYLQTIHNFGAGTDGADPNAALINVNGTFYGTTESGGTSEFGTVFSLTPAGVETVLHEFTGVGTDGGGPDGTLLNVNGTFYGTTGAGYNKNGAFSGTLFSITPAGVLATLHTFGTGPDGIAPLGNLIKVGNALYGTSWSGGTDGKGTVFKYKLQ
jgi:uncharacterized repeat protein (TIGR03803 family)